MTVVKTKWLLWIVLSLWQVTLLGSEKTAELPGLHILRDSALLRCGTDIAASTLKIPLPDPRDPALEGQDIEVAVPLDPRSFALAFLAGHEDGYGAYRTHRRFGRRLTDGTFKVRVTRLPLDRTMEANHPRIQLEHPWEGRGVVPLNDAIEKLEKARRPTILAGLEKGYRVTVNRAPEQVMRHCSLEVRPEKIRFKKPKLITKKPSRWPRGLYWPAPKEVLDENHPPQFIFKFQDREQVLAQGWYYNMDEEGNILKMTTSWLDERMIQMFLETFALGRGISVEVWDREGNLVGGTFGTLSKGMYTGWSLFYDEDKGDSAGILAMGSAMYLLHLMGHDFTDAEEVQAGNLTEQLGGVEVNRLEFMQLLDKQAQHRPLTEIVQPQELDLMPLLYGPTLTPDRLAKFLAPAGTFQAIRRMLRWRGHRSDILEKDPDRTSRAFLQELFAQELSKPATATKKAWKDAKAAHQEHKSEATAKALEEATRLHDIQRGVTDSLTIRMNKLGDPTKTKWPGGEIRDVLANGSPEAANRIWQALYLLVHNQKHVLREALATDLNDPATLFPLFGWEYFPSDEALEKEEYDRSLVRGAARAQRKQERANTADQITDDPINGDGSPEGGQPSSSPPASATEGQ